MPRHSIGEYPTNWNEIAKAVKDEANWHCIRCGERHDVSAGYMLTVHHLDLDPSNNVWWNTLALCQRCHLRIQAKVVLEQPWMFEHSDWFKPYVAGYYAHTNGLPEEREYVMDHLGDLLLLGRYCIA
jgi:5-methylcytosine-specific restriction endonuclease McrA